MEYILILVLIGCNAVLAMAEIAVVSSDRFKLKSEAQRGNERANIVLQFRQHPGQFLSSVQVGITLIGILAGAVSGVKLAVSLTPAFIWMGLAPDWAYRLAFITIVGIITFLNILIGELVPKTFALSHPEKTAIQLAKFVKFLSKIFFPVVYLLTKSTSFFTGLMGLQPQNESPVSENHIRDLIRTANQQGVLHNKETELLQNIFRFANRRAHQIMTPAKDLVWIDVNKPEKARQLIKNSPFTKFLIADTDLNQPIGYINVKDFVEKKEVTSSSDIRDLVHPAVKLYKNDSTIAILDRFSNTRVYFGMVIDKSEKVVGIITLHDLTEGIFGDLPYKDEIIEQPILVRANGSLLVNGNVLIDEILEYLPAPGLFTEEESFETIAQFLLEKLEDQFPKGGEIIHHQNWRFEIVDVDGIEIDKVLVSQNKQQINQ